MRYIGYPRLTFLDIEDPINVSSFLLSDINFYSLKIFIQPWSVYPVQNNIPAIFSFYQTSIYDDKSKRIFFFGGRYTDLVNFGQYDHTFDNSITFNLTDGTWGSQNMSGNTRPNRRIHHTTNIGEPTSLQTLVHSILTILMQWVLIKETFYCMEVKLLQMARKVTVHY